MNFASKVIVFLVVLVGVASTAWLVWYQSSQNTDGTSPTASVADKPESTALAKLKPSTARQSDSADLPLLTIGSVAPELDISDWVSDGRGTFPHITQFEPGKVYVVEFWATWCGPCIMSMPHLAATQTEFREKNVQIISVSDEDLDTITTFLASPVKESANARLDEASQESEGKKQTYGELTSVYCLTTDPDGSVNRDYMQAAKQNGIPTSFIVGKSGHIEWIGHPMEMDEPLRKVVDDTWDRESHLATVRAEQEKEATITGIENALQQEKFDEAKKLIADAQEKFSGDPKMLAMLDDADLNLKLMPVIRHLQSEEFEDALDRIDTIAKTATPQQLFNLDVIRLSIAMTRQDFTAASASISKLLESPKLGPGLLRQIVSQVVNAEEPTKTFPVAFVETTIQAAEKLVLLAPGAQSSELLEKLSKIRASYAAEEK